MSVRRASPGPPPAPRPLALIAGDLSPRFNPNKTTLEFNRRRSRGLKVTGNLFPTFTARNSSHGKVRDTVSHWWEGSPGLVFRTLFGYIKISYQRGTNGAMRSGLGTA